MPSRWEEVVHKIQLKTERKLRGQVERIRRVSPEEKVIIAKTLRGKEKSIA